MSEAFRFLIAGLINTLTGYSIFWIMWNYAGFSPEVSNIIGYLMALFLAFTLNYFYVFTDSVANIKTVPKFLASFGVAFALNQAVLLILYKIFFVTPWIAQIFAMLTYTVVFYLLNKFYVFSFKNEE